MAQPRRIRPARSAAGSRPVRVARVTIMSARPTARLREQAGTATSAAPDVTKAIRFPYLRPSARRGGRPRMAPVTRIETDRTDHLGNQITIPGEKLDRDGKASCVGYSTVRGDGEPHRGHVLNRGTGRVPTRPGHKRGDRAVQAKQGGVMAKRHSRPSTQYRYEHYDPFTGIGR